MYFESPSETGRRAKVVAGDIKVVEFHRGSSKSFLQLEVRRVVKFLENSHLGLPSSFEGFSMDTLNFFLEFLNIPSLKNPQKLKKKLTLTSKAIKILDPSCIKWLIF